jgi:hypothetical protein
MRAKARSIVKVRPAFQPDNVRGRPGNCGPRMGPCVHGDYSGGSSRTRRPASLNRFADAFGPAQAAFSVRPCDGVFGSPLTTTRPLRNVAFSCEVRAEKPKSWGQCTGMRIGSQTCLGVTADRWVDMTRRSASFFVLTVYVSRSFTTNRADNSLERDANVGLCSPSTRR